ncbi:unnamed protein product [Heligmosomoides polygyrus]|uniref:Neur_chan_LBD domain-containing protein n=1 Tax=Heligmosomoides polygyrus TaxID=6339 RepID=A0A183GL05_HELPZ|nr:unnamed protein product [Heligmosomoides polygyrus]
MSAMPTMTVSKVWIEEQELSGTGSRVDLVSTEVAAEALVLTAPTVVRELLIATVMSAALTSWNDPRKSWLPSEDGENTFNIDAALTPGEFRHVYAGLWIPSIKNRFKLLTFKSSANLYSDRLSFTSTGEIQHDFRFVLMIACLISDINYPYDLYVCYERFGDYDKNTTVRYTSEF